MDPQQQNAMAQMIAALRNAGQTGTAFGDQQGQQAASMGNQSGIGDSLYQQAQPYQNMLNNPPPMAAPPPPLY